MATAVTAVLLLIALWVLSVGIYRALFHSVSTFPGPRLWGITQVFMAYNLANGCLPHKIFELHKKYGPVVRIAPNEISFTTLAAWNDIYCQKINGQELQKHHTFLPPSTGVDGLIFEVDDAEHKRLRRCFSNAFSDRSLREQEIIILKYTNEMIAKLYDNISQPVNVCDWLDFTFFDITGALLFSDTFNALHDSSLHPWIAMLFDWVAGAVLLGMANEFWPISGIIKWLIPKAMRNAEASHRLLTQKMLDERLSNPAPYLDLVSNIQRFLGKKLTYTELLETCRVILVGGSETMATSLSGVIYYLIQNPHVLSKLTTEVRSTFKSASEINGRSVLRLEYQLAVINEGLRLFPPLPGNIRRITPPQGCVISGHIVPGNTIVGVDIYAANRSSDNFVCPEDFYPERWLPNAPSLFQHDKRRVSQPFSLGPRNCIAKNLVYMEMSLVLAKIIFEFNLEIEAESKNWLQGLKAFGFWLKPKLMARITPRDRTQTEASGVIFSKRHKSGLSLKG